MANDAQYKSEKAKSMTHNPSEELDRLTQEALADVGTGRVIDHQAVQAWADNLGADQQLPVPYQKEKSMIYFPAYVHLGLGHSASGYFPGIPGACIFAGCNIEECVEDAKSALEAHLELMNLPTPVPTKVSDYLDDKDLVGGFWVMVGVDPSKFEGTEVEISVSIRAGLLNQIDQAIQDSPARYPSRDDLIVRAVRKMLNHP